MLHDLSKQQEADNAFQFITSEAARNSTIEIRIVKPHNVRSLRQNNSLHLSFTQIADQLNEGGLDVKKVLTKPVDVPWNETLVKELIFRPLMKAVTGKESSTKLTTFEIDRIFHVLIRYFGEKFDLSIEFPSQNNKEREI